MWNGSLTKQSPRTSSVHNPLVVQGQPFHTHDPCMNCSCTVFIICWHRTVDGGGYHFGLVQLNGCSLTPTPAGLRVWLALGTQNSKNIKKLLEMNNDDYITTSPEYETITQITFFISFYCFSSSLTNHCIILTVQQTGLKSISRCNKEQSSG